MISTNTSLGVEGSSPEFVFAVDLGGTHLRAAIIDREGTIHSRLKQDTSNGSADELVRALGNAFRECVNQLNETDLGTAPKINAACVAVPGTVDIAAGVVVKVPNLHQLEGFPLAATVTEELQIPTTIENDANAAAVGELWMGAASGLRSIVCVTLGTGVGGGIILDRKLWRGTHGSAAEVGHMCVEPLGEAVCGCGSRGCLEAYASGTAIVRLANELSLASPQSSLHGAKDLTSEKVYDAGLASDEVALEVFRRMGSYLGIGLANLINVLDPEMIVIGGGVANGWTLFEKYMDKEVAERAFPAPNMRAKIARAECGDDAGLLGAAHLALSSGSQSAQADE